MSVLKFKSGHSRNVILFHKWAIKIPSFFSWNIFVEGLLNNTLEKDIYNTSPNGIRLKSIKNKRGWTNSKHSPFCLILYSFFLVL